MGALAAMVSGPATVSEAVTGARPAKVPSNSASIFASKSSTISMELAENHTLKSCPQPFL